jgi:predicted HAD superfamily Cof-like phosphohydrolase
MTAFKLIINQVKEFHTVFGLGHEEKPRAFINEKTIELRHRLMAEENDEYLEAAKNNDLEQVADALGDKLYILCGTILAHGMQHKIVEIFEEIHRSNMSKLDENGKPIYREDGKILKSSNYFVPNINKVLSTEQEVG